MPKRLTRLQKIDAIIDLLGVNSAFRVDIHALLSMLSDRALTHQHKHCLDIKEHLEQSRAE